MFPGLSLDQFEHPGLVLSGELLALCRRHFACGELFIDELVNEAQLIRAARDLQIKIPFEFLARACALLDVAATSLHTPA